MGEMVTDDLELVLRGLPQVFAVAPSVNLGLGSLPPQRLKYASGLFNMMRNLGGSVGIAVLETFVAKREQFHSSIITAHGGSMNLQNDPKGGAVIIVTLPSLTA